VTAFLDKRLFEEGASVKEGQELFRLERDTFEADVEAAKALLAQAEARTEVKPARRETPRGPDGQ